LGKTPTHGHYVAYVKKGGEWVLFNDNIVKVPKEPVLGKGYVYLYEAVWLFWILDDYGWEFTCLELVCIDLLYWWVCFNWLLFQNKGIEKYNAHLVEFKGFTFCLWVY